MITDRDELAYVDPQRQWPGLKGVAKINYRRNGNEESPTDTRYYICSYQAMTESLLQATRDHWGIENSLHWVLDVAFDEDRCRVRTGYASQNLAVARHWALNRSSRSARPKPGSRPNGKRPAGTIPICSKSAHLNMRWPCPARPIAGQGHTALNRSASNRQKQS